MFSRRDFMAAGAVTGAAALVARPAWGTIKSDIGLQLMPLRSTMDDPGAALAQIAKLGFTSVEAGPTYSGSQLFYGMTPAAFASALSQNGLSMLSSTYFRSLFPGNGKPSLGTLQHGWDKAVDDAAAIGLTYMVCIGLNDNERGNIDQYKVVAHDLNQAGMRCKKAGIQLCYHNHDFEFVSQNGQRPYDTLLQETDKSFVRMELDLFGMTYAGVDPLNYIALNPGRFPLWHVDIRNMDLPPDPQRRSTVPRLNAPMPERAMPKPAPVKGNIKIDFKKLFAHAAEAGLKHCYIENTAAMQRPLDVASDALAFMKQVIPS